MSKLIVDRIVARATSDVDRAKNEAQMPELFRNIQAGFRNSTLLAGQESLAELCGLITGFRPRTSNNPVQPFEVFGVMSKAEQRVTKWAMCVVSAGGITYGCSSLGEGYVQYNAETCRMATPEEALDFIKTQVSGWEDTAVLNWVNGRLGAAYFPVFFAELDRTIPAQVAASKGK